MKNAQILALISILPIAGLAVFGASRLVPQAHAAHSSLRYRVQTSGQPSLVTAPASRLAADGVTLTAPPDSPSNTLSASQAVAVVSVARPGEKVEEAVLANAQDTPGGVSHLVWAVSITPAHGIDATLSKMPTAQSPITPPAMSGFYVVFLDAYTGSVLGYEAQEWPSSQSAFKLYVQRNRQWLYRHHRLPSM